MNVDYEYFMSRNLARYSGDWVIIVKARVVAHGPRRKIKQMVRRAKKDYPDESLFIARVPQKTEQIL